MEIHGTQKPKKTPEEEGGEMLAWREVLDRIAQDAKMDPHVFGQILEDAIKLGEQREKCQAAKHHSPENQPSMPNLSEINEHLESEPSGSQSNVTSVVPLEEKKEQAAKIGVNHEPLAVNDSSSLPEVLHEISEGNYVDVQQQVHQDEQGSQSQGVMHEEEIEKKVVRRRAPRGSRKRTVGVVPEPRHNYETRQKQRATEPAELEDTAADKMIDDPQEEEHNRPAKENAYDDSNEKEEVQITKNTYTVQELRDMMVSCDHVRQLIRDRPYLPKLTEYVFYELCREALRGLITKNMFREELLQLLFVARDILLNFNWEAIQCKIWFKNDTRGDKYYSLQIPYVGKKNYPIDPSIIPEYEKQFMIAERKHSAGIKSSDYFANVHLF